MRRSDLPRDLGALAVLLAALAAPFVADAACNFVAQRNDSFSSTLGATDRPFAAPGEAIKLRVRPCDASTGFTPVPGDHDVTFAFVPPGGGSERQIVLSTDWV